MTPESAQAAVRLHVGTAAAATGGAPPLVAQAEFDLPEGAARHARVRRVQPGQGLRLFDGSGVDWPAEVLAITRSAVRVRLGTMPLEPPGAELPGAVTLAFCMPANERVDALVEKATELGATALQPLMSERSVLRLAGERAERRRAHWQGVAMAACEQCGRARGPALLPVRPLEDWLRGEAARMHAGNAWLLSTARTAPPVRERWREARMQGEWVVLSGPEGGLSPAEEAAAQAAGFVAVSLGPRILRADTAPLAALAWLSISLAAIDPAAAPTPKSG
jgi:16S rRNA (uracil1498-N3)-methyltransferase